MDHVELKMPVNGLNKTDRFNVGNNPHNDDKLFVEHNLLCTINAHYCWLATNLDFLEFLFNQLVCQILQLPIINVSALTICDH